ncbi:MAG: O-sialoglycoprotein endopeptidase, O-sialoglycoprotein endopeptidase, partial [Candidatus Wolfebacteria bacterium GW2011_GWC1_43_10]
MKILAIETSCDETAVALLRASGKLSSIKLKVLKSLVSSQIKIHAPFGGVVPNLAKREHLKNLPILLSKILNTKYHAYRQAGGIRNVDLIAVTVGPGLEPALWVGIEFAKRLAKKWKKPLIGVNHLHGHLYSFLLSQKTVSTKFQAPKSKKPGIRHTVYGIRNPFPAIGLIVSGGHTILVLMKNLKEYKKL